MPADSNFVTKAELNQTVSGLGARIEKNLNSLIKKAVREELAALSLPTAK